LVANQILGVAEQGAIGINNFVKFLRFLTNLFFHSILSQTQENTGRYNSPADIYADFVGKICGISSVIFVVKTPRLFL